MTEPPVGIARLIIGHLKHELTADEQEQLTQWRSASSGHEALFQEMVDEGALTNDMQQVLTYDRETALKKAMALEFPAERQTRRWKYLAAAVILILLSAGTIWLLLPRKQAPTITQTTRTNKIVPGSNQATLTLSDHSVIVLNDASNGELSQQGNAVLKKQNGMLEYRQLFKSSSHSLLYNTLTTPKGGQYRLVLPDGTGVWLNAASSITYPVAFNGQDRAVTIQGEAYFEVTADAARPFKVSVNDLQVEVHGTHFNINAYSDEPFLQTTLLEGAVTVTKGNRSIRLQPGQAARGLSLVEKPDLQEAIAWKNGVFYFRNAALETVLRQVARWYNVEIKYKEKVQQQFNGEIPRDVNVSEVFEILESTGWVHFKINGREIIVTQ